MTNTFAYIRVDASPEIGLGHLVRCIALANMLKQKFTPVFYIKKNSIALSELFKSNGFNVNYIFEEAEFLSSLQLDSIVILDGYHFDVVYQQRIIDTGAKLVCIDDLHDKKFLAHLILNHAPGLSPSQYSAMSYTHFLLGPDYALLRPEFIVSPDTPTKTMDKYKEGSKKVLICFGGSDYRNLTLSVLKKVWHQDMDITLITGSAYPYEDTLNALLKKTDKNIKHCKALSASEMRRAFSNADLAIVPASGILFEAISVGVPIISGYYTQNQFDIYQGFLNMDVIYDAKDFSNENFGEAWNSVNEVSSKKMVAAQAQSIDGQSPSRILKAIEAL